MSQIGWTKDTFKPGDEVEFEAMQAKNGNPVRVPGERQPRPPQENAS